MGEPNGDAQSGWFELRAGEQAIGLLLARPWLLALPALTASVGLVLLLAGLSVAGLVMLLTAVAQALVPLGAARRSCGTGTRRVSVEGGRWLEIRAPIGEVHRWDLLRCRVRASERLLHVEVTPGRGMTVPRRAVATAGGWEALGAAVRLVAAERPRLGGTYVAFRSDHSATRPFDLPIPATIGVLFRQQARSLFPLLALLAVVQLVLAPSAAMRVVVVTGFVAVGVWSLLAGSTARVLALARREITRGNVVEALDGGLLHDHPGCSSLRPWTEVSAVRARRGGAAEVRYGRRRTVLPAGAFSDLAHRDAFVNAAGAFASLDAGRRAVSPHTS